VPELSVSVSADGNPEGLQGTVSDGIISAFRGDRSYIQITAPISPGSSGSPVLDESGQVIGMATLVYREGQNLNFAISSETIRAYLTSDDAKRQASQGTPSKKQQENSAYNSQTGVMNRIVSMVREFVAASSSGSGVTESSLYLWLNGKTKPADPARLVSFLNSLPGERSGIMPTGYEYREYKNWRGIPKPRRCPFCKKRKGEIRKVRGAFQGSCPNCGATGPLRKDHGEALRAWNGKS
jgi:hypothetical protein